MEKTFVICKPDCMAKKHVGEVISRFEKEGFEIVAAKLMRLTPALLREHYAHILSLSIYPKLEEFMSQSPVLALVIKGDNVVARVRELLGPTDSTQAAKGTIRGDWGETKMFNIAHASDSVENGKIEIARFFKPEEVLG